MSQLWLRCTITLLVDACPTIQNSESPTLYPAYKAVIVILFLQPGETTLDGDNNKSICILKKIWDVVNDMYKGLGAG